MILAGSGGRLVKYHLDGPLPSILLGMSGIQTAKNKTIALAGLMQSVYLCKNLANYGRCDADQLSTSLKSILHLDADAVPDVYEGVANISKGLNVLKTQMTLTDPQRDLDLSRYSASLIQLTDNVMADDGVTGKITDGIRQSATLDFAILDPTMISSLANIYRNNVSHMSPRIMVGGSPEYLNNEAVTTKIRATLLAGIRAVVLWRQCGGTKPGLLFSRNQYLQQVQEILER